MDKNIVALYDDFEAAADAVRDLVDHGFSREDISLMSMDASGKYARQLGTDIEDTQANEPVEGVDVGVGVGAVLGGVGGLLVGLGVLAIPGIGPVLAAGPLASVLTALASAGIGAAAGGLTGGLIGGLVDMGVPEETAQSYVEGVRRGGTLVTLRTNEQYTAEATRLLNQHDPVNINERAETWRESGWGATERGSEATEPYPSYQAYGTFEDYEPRFRTHFMSSAYSSQYPYDQYRPAYYYGYTLATDERYRNRNWEDVEPEAQRYWDESEPGAWERFKDSVRHAWDEMREAVR
ncbi:MAG: hypothetical protein ACOYYS_25195 [Chloroflexota bacterium]